MKIGLIVIHCVEFERMLAFWQEALHYTRREPATAGWVVLRGPNGQSPNGAAVAKPSLRKHASTVRNGRAKDRAAECRLCDC
jgi:hypothetical protein